jgi:hypothetical protein
MLIGETNVPPPQQQQQMLQNMLQSFAPQITNMVQQIFSSSSNGASAQGFIHVGNLGRIMNSVLASLLIFAP